MARLRTNFVSGQTLNSPLAVGGTSLTSAALAALPAVATPDVLALVLDPDSTDPEIVHVTAHTATENTVTILRAQEGTVAREHAALTKWIHAPTATDYVPPETDALRSYMTLGGVDPLNDEFTDGSLDAAWVRSDSSGEAGHLTWTEAAGVLSAYHTGTDAAAELHGLVKPMGAFAIGKSIQVGLEILARAENSPMGGLIICDGIARGSGTQIVGGYWNDTTSGNTGIRRSTGWTVDAANLTHFTPGNVVRGIRMHLRLKWAATNSFQFAVSRDGVGWIWQAAQAYTVTPTHVGIFVTSWGATSDIAYTFDYFRVI